MKSGSLGCKMRESQGGWGGRTQAGRKAELDDDSCARVSQCVCVSAGRPPKLRPTITRYVWELESLGLIINSNIIIWSSCFSLRSACLCEAPWIGLLGGRPCACFRLRALIYTWRVCNRSTTQRFPDLFVGFHTSI